MLMKAEYIVIVLDKNCIRSPALSSLVSSDAIKVVPRIYIFKQVWNESNCKILQIKFSKASFPQA